MFNDYLIMIRATSSSRLHAMLFSSICL